MVGRDGGTRAAGATELAAERAVMEALEAVMSEAVRTSVLSRAFRDVGVADLPHEAELLPFVEGPLFRAIAEEMDEDVADAIVSNLRPICQLLHVRESVVRHRTPPRGAATRERTGSPTVATPVPPADANQVVICVATRDRHLVRQLASKLESVGRVVIVDDPNVLSRARVSTLIVDGKLPGLDRETLRAFVQHLAAGTRVVAWGVDPKTAWELEREAGHRHAWVPVASECGAAELSLLAGGAGPTKAAPPHADRWVLVVHEDGAAREELAGRVRRLGYHVREATGATHALARCGNHPPQVVLAAASLEGMDGVKLAATLHLVYEERAPHTVVVASEDDVVCGALDHVASVVPRRVSDEKLAHTLRLLLP